MLNNSFQCSLVAFSLLLVLCTAAKTRDAKDATALLSSLSAATAGHQSKQKDQKILKKLLSPTLIDGINQVMLNVPVGVVRTPIGLRVMVENMLVPAQAIIAQNPAFMASNAQQSTQQGSGGFPVVIQPGILPAGSQGAASAIQPQVAPQTIQQDSASLTQPLAAPKPAPQTSPLPIVPGPESGVPIGIATTPQQQQQQQQPPPSLPPIADSANVGASYTSLQVPPSTPQLPAIISTHGMNSSSANPGSSAKSSSPGQANVASDAIVSLYPSATRPIPLPATPLGTPPAASPAPASSIVPALNASTALSRQAQIPLQSGSGSVQSSENMSNTAAGANSSHSASLKSFTGSLPYVVSSNTTSSRSISMAGNSTALTQGKSLALREDDGLSTVIENVYKNTTFATPDTRKPTPVATMTGKNFTQGQPMNMTLARNSDASALPIASVSRPPQNLTQTAHLEASPRQSVQSGSESRLQHSAMVNLNTTTRSTLGFKARIKTSSAPIWSSIWYVSGCSSAFTLLFI